MEGSRNHHFGARIGGGAWWLNPILFACLLLVSWIPAHAGAGSLEVRGQYFWDPTTGRYFFPHGIAYQSWNPPVGSNQSLEQVTSDLVEFKKMHANSVRAEMVWNVVERGPGVFDWTKPDHLVQQAERLGLKLFVLIGFQYAPDWAPEEWKALNAENTRSFVLSIENPDAQRAYSNYIAQVTSRYRNSRAIGAWILGNEFAYFDLWEPERRYIGYDSHSLTQFRFFLRRTYDNDLAAATNTWKTNFASFDEVEMPRVYPPNRDQPLFNDLLRWRKQSIGDYVALGARAARQADPNHLLSYSMIGGLFGEADSFYTAEDGRTIVQACEAAGVPLDFWSINNYSIAALDSELRAGDFGIAKHQADTGLPVLLSETGHTSTEDLHPDATWRQAAAIPTQLWEAVVSGAMGVHVFTWNDRDFFSGDYFPREKGFGIVGQNRLPKDPAFRNVAQVFQRMSELDIGRLVGGSTNPASDIQIFWTQSSDLSWPRVNQELTRVWGTLKRLGYQPSVIRDEEFEAKGWTNAQAMMLCRAFQMDPTHLDTLATEVVARGVNVHALVDPPGQYDAYHRANPRWAEHMQTLFGLDTDGAEPARESNPKYTEYEELSIRASRDLPPLPANYQDKLVTWRQWNGLRPVAGETILTHSGSQPALHVHDLGTARTAITPLGLGDVAEASLTPWRLRYQWLQAIYQYYFGLVPPIEVTGAGAEWVYPDFRVCRNGSILLGFFNGYTNAATTLVRAPTLLLGRTIENLTSGGIVETNSDGEISLSLGVDEYVLLYATARPTDSLINASPVKLWFESAPASVWSGGAPASVVVGYDTQGASVQFSLGLEEEGATPRTRLTSTPQSIQGKGTLTLPMPLPDPDIRQTSWVSSLSGARYVWHASATGGGGPAASARVPVRVLWGVRPESLPEPVKPGSTYAIPVHWEELPGFLPGEAPTAFDRADLWDSVVAGQQLYSIHLELWSNTQLVQRWETFTREATGSAVFNVVVPGGLSGPFRWIARARTAPGASADVLDSFESRSLGADTALTNNLPSRMTPWVAYHYSANSNPGNLYFDTGTRLEASHGGQSAFLIYTNPPSVGAYSGFGMIRNFPTTWSLPPWPFNWDQYTFSCDVREARGNRLNIDLQLKSSNNPGEPPSVSHAIQQREIIPYTANGSWQRVQARLDQFYQPDFLARFDRTRVAALVINFEMLDTGVVYEVSVDNIRWDGPEQSVPGDEFATYLSANDSAAPPRDSDGDGLPDAIETGTGIYVGPTNTGTRPNQVDSDGDGQSDGDEVTAGTNPNAATEMFVLDSIRLNEEGQPALSWTAKSGRWYSLSFVDDLPGPGAPFFPVPDATGLSVVEDGRLEVIDSFPAIGSTRYYRLEVRAPY